MSSTSIYPCHNHELTPGTAYTEYCIHRALHTPSSVLLKDWMSAAPSQSLISQWNLLYSTLYIPTMRSLSINRVSAPMAPPSKSTSSRSTDSKNSNLDWLWPPSASSNLLGHGLQVCLQTCMIIASQFAQSWPPTVSLSGYADSSQVHLWGHSMSASKCNPILTQSPGSSASPNSLDYGLQVHGCVYSMFGSKCISKLTQSRPSSSSPTLLNHRLKVHL